MVFQPSPTGAWEPEVFFRKRLCIDGEYHAGLLMWREGEQGIEYRLPTKEEAAAWRDMTAW